MAASDSLGPGFRALFAGSLVSNLGDGIRLAAVPLLAASLTSSALLISTVTAAQYLAWLTFGPAGGALVDRLDRRRIILVTQAARGVLIGVLAVLVVTSQAAIWQLCIVAFAINHFFSYRYHREVDTSGTRLLRDTCDQLFDLLTDHHEQVSELIYHYHNVRQRLQFLWLCTRWMMIRIEGRIFDRFTRLDSIFYLAVEAGDRVIIETPGGGGYGAA